MQPFHTATLLSFISTMLFLLTVVKAAQINIAVVCHGDWTNSSDFFSFPADTIGIPTLFTFVQGTRMYTELLNNEGGVPTYDVNNTRVNFNVTYFNIGNSSQTWRAGNLSQKLTNGEYGNFSVIIAPGFSLDDIVIVFMLACETTESCICIAPLTPSTAVFVCTDPLPSDCKRAGDRRFQYGFSVLYDGDYALSGHLSIYRQQQFTRIAILYSSQQYGLLASNTTADTAFGLGLSVVSTIMFDPDIPWTLDTTLSVINTWQALGVQAVCILSNGADLVALASLVTLFQQFEVIDWVPDSIAMGGSISTSVQAAVTNEQFAYVLTEAQWDWHLTGRAYDTQNTSYNLALFPSTPSMSSPAVFRETLFAYYNTTVSDTDLVYAADAAQSLAFVEKFIENANAFDVESMRTASREVSVPSLNGQLQLDADGRTVVSDALVFENLLNGSRIILSPLSIGMTPILPTPQYSQRSFISGFFQTSVERVAIAITTVCLTYVAIVVVGFVVYSKHPVIKAATPLFCILMCVGGALMLLSTYVTGLYVTSTSCAAQLWLLTTGFSLMFGALFMKTYRVFLIFQAGKKLRKVAISNQLLLLWLSVLMSFDVILNITATAMQLFQAEYIVVDPYRPVYNYQTCVTTGGTKTALLLTALEKAFLIMAAVVLTIAARNVPSKFNETPYLASAIYNNLLVCAFAMGIVASGVGGRTVSYAVQVFGVQVLVLSTLSIVFVPKFWLIWNIQGNRALEQFGDQSIKNSIIAVKPGNTNTTKTSADNGSRLGKVVPLQPHGAQAANNHLETSPKADLSTTIIETFQSSHDDGVENAANQSTEELLSKERYLVNKMKKMESYITQLQEEIERRSQRQLESERDDNVELPGHA